MLNKVSSVLVNKAEKDDKSVFFCYLFAKAGKVQPFLKYHAGKAGEKFCRACSLCIDVSLLDHAKLRLVFAISVLILDPRMLAH